MVDLKDENLVLYLKFFLMEDHKGDGTVRLDGTRRALEWLKMLLMVTTRRLHVEPQNVIALGYKNLLAYLL